MSQAQAILAAFETYLLGGIGVRRIVLERSPAGFLVTLEDARSCLGSDLADSASQIATVVQLEGGL